MGRILVALFIFTGLLLLINTANALECSYSSWTLQPGVDYDSCYDGSWWIIGSIEGCYVYQSTTETCPSDQDWCSGVYPCQRYYVTYSCSDTGCKASTAYAVDNSCTYLCPSGQACSGGSCVAACTPAWSCTDWSPLPSSSNCGTSVTQTRACTDSNSCETTAGKPPESQTAAGTYCSSGTCSNGACTAVCNSDSDCPECQFCPGPNSVCIADSLKNGAPCTGCDGGACSCYSSSGPGKCLPATCSGYCTSVKGYQFGKCEYGGIVIDRQYEVPSNTYDCIIDTGSCYCKDDCPTACEKQGHDTGECYTGTKSSPSPCSGQTRTYYYGIGSSGKYSCNIFLLQGCWCEDKNICQTDCGGSQACNGATIGSGCSKEGKVGTCDSSCQCVTDAKECNTDDDCKNKGVTCAYPLGKDPNRYAGCDSTAHTCTRCGPCVSSSTDCVLGSCCEQETPGPGNIRGQCVSQIYSEDPSWLCTT